MRLFFGNPIGFSLIHSSAMPARTSLCWPCKKIPAWLSNGPCSGCTLVHEQWMIVSVSWKWVSLLLWPSQQSHRLPSHWNNTRLQKEWVDVCTSCTGTFSTLVEETNQKKKKAQLSTVLETQSLICAGAAMCHLELSGGGVRTQTCWARRGVKRKLEWKQRKRRAGCLSFHW